MTHRATTVAETPFDYEYTLAAVEVRVSELIVVTAEQDDPLIDEAVRMVLRILRQQHNTEAAFVSEFIDGKQVQRALSSPWRGGFHNEQEGDLLEFVVGRQVVPESAAAKGYFSVPVVLSDGRLYGTLYSACFAQSEDLRQHALKRLEMTAQLAARLINARRNQLVTGAASTPHGA